MLIVEVLTRSSPDNDVQNNEHGNPEALTHSWCIAYQVGKWSHIITAEGRRVDKICLDVIENTSGKRKMAYGLEEDWRCYPHTDQDDAKKDFISQDIDRKYLLRLMCLSNEWISNKLGCAKSGSSQQCRAPLVIRLANAHPYPYCSGL